MKAQEIISKLDEALTAEQIQLIKDTIRHGAWGNSTVEFRKDDGTLDEDYGYGYCTNDAKKGGHFSGRQVSAMFRSIYQRLGILGKGHGANEWVFYCNDWWRDGSGDMLFFRIESSSEELYDSLMNWAKS